MATEFLSEQDIEKVLNEVINRFLIPKFNDLGMNASGEWKENLEVRGSSIWGRKYTEQLVYGRRPGTFAPIEPLRQWAIAKLGISPEQATGVAYAINWNMKEKGTTWFQKGGSDLLEVLESKEVIDYITKEFQEIIKNQVIIRVKRDLKILT